MTASEHFELANARSVTQEIRGNDKYWYRKAWQGTLGRLRPEIRTAFSASKLAHRIKEGPEKAIALTALRTREMPGSVYPISAPILQKNWQQEFVDHNSMYTTQIIANE